MATVVERFCSVSRTAQKELIVAVLSLVDETEVPPLTQQPTIPFLTASDISKMKVAELKAALAARGRPANDKKAALARQLMDFEASREQPGRVAGEADADPNRKRRTPIILVLDSELHGIPWENLPALVSFPISRLPSFEFIPLGLQKSWPNWAAVEHKVRWSKSSLVLNPSGELTATERTLQSIRDLVASKGGKVHVGRPPTQKEMK